MYYSFHGKLKQLLRTEEYYVTTEKAPFSYRSHFPNIGKSMPIRSYRNEMYAMYLGGVK